MRVATRTLFLLVLLSAETLSQPIETRVLNPEQPMHLRFIRMWPRRYYFRARSGARLAWG
jgi:hypothetical protein